MYDFLMWFPYPIRMVVIFGILFSVVPLAGLCTFGNWRQDWRYARAWGLVIGWMVAAAAVMLAIFWVVFSN